MWKAIKRTDRLVFLGDTNAHLHSGEPREIEHASHLRGATEQLGITIVLKDEAVSAFTRPASLDPDDGGVQDDYIGVAHGVAANAGTLRSVIFAHGANKGIS